MNSLGELMGINTLSFDKSNDGETPEGIGFAIPFQLATKIMDKLIRDGRVIRGYIGISGREIAPLHAQGGGIDQIQGIVVNDVAPDGPAAQAGIRANDVIISVNDKPAVSALETMDQVAEIRPGSEIPVVIMRDDKKITLHIAVGNTRPPTKRLPVWGATLIAKYRTGRESDQKPGFHECWTIKSRNSGSGSSVRARLLVDEVFAERDIFLQGVQHALQRLLFKGAEFADRLSLFHAVFPQQQRLGEETRIVAVAFHVGALHHAFFPLHGANQRETKTGSRLAHRQGRRPAARFRFHDFGTGVLNTFSQVGNFLIAKADAGDLRQ